MIFFSIGFYKLNFGFSHAWSRANLMFRSWRLPFEIPKWEGLPRHWDNKLRWIPPTMESYGALQTRAWGLPAHAIFFGEHDT